MHRHRRSTVALEAPLKMSAYAPDIQAKVSEIQRLAVFAHSQIHERYLPLRMVYLVGGYTGVGRNSLGGGFHYYAERINARIVRQQRGSGDMPPRKNIRFQAF